MERLLIAVVILVVALVVAWFAQRRRPDAPMQTSADRLLPHQLDRGDFTSPEQTYLVAVFSSDSCDACASVLAAVETLAAPDVAIQNISWQFDKDLHDRYAIETVPATVIAGPDGVVGAGFLGQMQVAELVESMTALRNTSLG
ncbi:MAG: hypothetical protein GY708_16785 [Actinomycetia bacterium]|nr:hypothetical protein [Actinomycetes bacterium]MCP4957858.1 hypothetical protein [Actinomycetes bacterium]